MILHRICCASLFLVTDFNIFNALLRQDPCQLITFKAILANISCCCMNFANTFVYDLRFYIFRFEGICHDIWFVLQCRLPLELSMISRRFSRIQDESTEAELFRALSLLPQSWKLPSSYPRMPSSIARIYH